MSHIDYKTLPKIGYVAMRDATIVAACFLRRVEGGYGQLDTLATNPYLGSKIRNEAINLLFDQLIGDAEELELVGLMVITEYASMIDRFQHRGFTKVNQTLIIKKL
jgi:N-acetylglutamate synthase-like GNAT family acetyltransferase